MPRRTATVADWKAFYPSQPPPEWWIGLAYEENGELKALGTVYLWAGDRFWVSITAKPEARRAWVIVPGCLEMIDVMRRAEVELYALCDRTIPGADRLLRFFGLEATGETVDGHEVYRWTP